MNNGRSCDNCDCHLEEEDYARPGSWSYICPCCGFKYNHSSRLTAEEQVEEFNEGEGEDEEE